MDLTWRSGFFPGNRPACRAWRRRGNRRPTRERRFSRPIRPERESDGAYRGLRAGHLEHVLFARRAGVGAKRTTGRRPATLGLSLVRWISTPAVRAPLDLVGATVVAISGNRQKIAVADGVTSLSFVPDDQSAPTALKPGDLLTITPPLRCLSIPTHPFPIGIRYGLHDVARRGRQWPAGRNSPSFLEQFYLGAFDEQRPRSERVRPGEVGERRHRSLCPYADSAAVEPAQLL